MKTEDALKIVEGRSEALADSLAPGADKHGDAHVVEVTATADDLRAMMSGIDIEDPDALFEAAKASAVNVLGLVMYSRPEGVHLSLLGASLQQILLGYVIGEAAGRAANE